MFIHHIFKCDTEPEMVQIELIIIFVYILLLPYYLHTIKSDFTTLFPKTLNSSYHILLYFLK